MNSPIPSPGKIEHNTMIWSTKQAQMRSTNIIWQKIYAPTVPSCPLRYLAKLVNMRLFKIPETGKRGKQKRSGIAF